MCQKILYGVPPSSTCYKRLKRFREKFGAESLSFLVDHSLQLTNLREGSEAVLNPIPILIKVDVGDHRAGIESGSKQLIELVQAITASNHVRITGLYAHMVSLQPWFLPTYDIVTLAILHVYTERF